ncbi:MAG TPA: protein-L-isoaspartate O-methyltransferase [Roseiarcus sp.]|nr:protein-L-isoaspartate O-methyltransferase [Roseiarcus sp.]
MIATESEERAQFTLAMRAKGIDDLSLLRALERAPRALFMPPRFADISGRDIALPIGCGQTSLPPSIVAAMIAALDLRPEHQVCEIGTGTGYCAALLAQLANTIVSLERFQTLAVEASARIKAFGLANVAVRWADGFELHLSGERFDRVLIHGLVEPPGEAFRRLIGKGGVLVAVVAGPERGEQHIVRLADGASQARDMGPARGMRPLEHGLARAL